MVIVVWLFQYEKAASIAWRQTIVTAQTSSNDCLPRVSAKPNGRG